MQLVLSHVENLFVQAILSCVSMHILVAIHSTLAFPVCFCFGVSVRIALWTCCYECADLRCCVFVLAIWFRIALDIVFSAYVPWSFSAVCPEPRLVEDFA